MRLFPSPKRGVAERRKASNQFAPLGARTLGRVPAFRRSTAAFSFRRRAALSSGLNPDRQPAPGRRPVVASRAEPRRRPSAGLRAPPAGAAQPMSGLPDIGPGRRKPHLRPPVFRPAPPTERLRKTPLGEQGPWNIVLIEGRRQEGLGIISMSEAGPQAQGRNAMQGARAKPIAASRISAAKCRTGRACE